MSLRETFPVNGPHVDDHRVLHQRHNACRIPSDFGVKADGVTDDTAALNAMLVEYAGRYCYVPAGTYQIDATVGLRPQNGTVLELSPGAALCAIPTDATAYSIILIDGKTGIIIRGGQIVGERGQHIGSAGEWGMGIKMLGSSSISLENVRVRDCWGDGVHIRGACQNVDLVRVRGTNNRRMGLCITDADSVRVLHSTFETSNGADPQAGAVCESGVGESISNILFHGCRFEGNVRQGIRTAGTWLWIVDCIARDNGLAGIRIQCGTHATVVGCISRGNGTSMELDRGNDVVIRGCDLDDAPVLVGLENVGIVELGNVVRV